MDEKKIVQAIMAGIRTARYLRGDAVHCKEFLRWDEEYTLFWNLAQEASDRELVSYTEGLDPSDPLVMHSATFKQKVYDDVL